MPFVCVCMGRSSGFEFLSMGGVRRACKSLLSKRHSERKSSLDKGTRDDESLKSVDKVIDDDPENFNDFQVSRRFGREWKDDTALCGGDSFGCFPSPQLSRSASTSNSKSANAFSRSSSRRSKTPTPSRKGLLKSFSRRSIDSTSSPVRAESLARTTSKRSSTIMYSNSTGMLKPPPMSMELECTLEDLCFGCIKKINTKRDAITDDGQIIQEDEVLTIKVKPGWRKGTKITFEGMGNDTPGTHQADVTFVIAEKKHPVFTCKGDDLELAVKVPLVKALTGCTLFVPLLGGKSRTLRIEDIICPGYEKIIEGQGMPLPKEQGKRGNLIISFLVEFPQELTEVQRSDAYNILQDSC